MIVQHTGHLFIDGQKMSKSLKNFTTIQEFLKDNSADIFRIFILQNLYRSSIHMSNDRIVEAQGIVAKFYRFVGVYFIN
jgi:cysteinyl-tRNA synthetase